MRESVSEMMRARARTRSTHLRTIDADRSLVVRGALRCHDDQWQCHALIADSRSFARSAVRGLRSRVRRDATEKGEENTHAHTHARTQHVRMHARTHVARTHARTHAREEAGIGDNALTKRTRWASSLFARLFFVSCFTTTI